MDDIGVRNHLDNQFPEIHSVAPRISRNSPADYDDSVVDEIDSREIFDLIRDINDPEHPLTLEQLNVVQEELINVDKDKDDVVVRVNYTPTIPHCSMANLIGLAIKVKLYRSLHPSVKVIVAITQDKHFDENAINRQLADKERIAAAMENLMLMNAVNVCLKSANR